MNKEINKIISWIEMSYTRLNYKEELLLVNYIKQLQQENKQLKDKIDKAIEYLDDWLFNVGGMGACMDYKDIIEILDILKEVE